MFAFPSFRIGNVSYVTYDYLLLTYLPNRKHPTIDAKARFQVRVLSMNTYTNIMIGVTKMTTNAITAMACVARKLSELIKYECLSNFT